MFTVGYVDSGAPSLKHQRVNEAEATDIDVHHIRGTLTAPSIQKYRKGACENCGAMTHKAKDCLERPRKVGAKFVPKDIRPDEFVQTAELSFDGKRDRWAGYDAEAYTEEVIGKYEKIEEEQRRLKDEAKKRKLESGEASSESSSSSDSSSFSDSETSDEEHDANGPVESTERDPKSRTVLRNLRLREDTAKYLRNLDPESAHYDPKTRSMRENPNPDRPSDPNLIPFEGDNFVRMSGDAVKIPELQVFAWQAAERGIDVNLVANPSLVEKLHKEHVGQKTEEAKRREKLLEEAYGNSRKDSSEDDDDSDNSDGGLFDTL